MEERKEGYASMIVDSLLKNVCGHHRICRFYLSQGSPCLQVDLSTLVFRITFYSDIRLTLTQDFYSNSN